jgi:hypothetical protein
MAIIRYVRSAATVSWIDARTGLPEVDAVPPAAIVHRVFLTGSSGFRFVNFMEVWANFDTQANTIVGHGFTGNSGLFRSPSYMDIPSQIGTTIQNVRVGFEPITFTQITGARTQSPEVIGGWIGGPAGNIFASMVKSFPPIWTEIQIQLYNNGSGVTSVLRHSLFPSMTYYTQYLNHSPSAAPGAFVPNWYSRTPFNGNPNYDGMPNYDRWYENGWGHFGTGTSGPITGNPWDMEKSITSGIDPTQPFGW